MPDNDATDADGSRAREGARRTTARKGSVVEMTQAQAATRRGEGTDGAGAPAVRWRGEDVPVIGSYDVVVVGGGASGSACGIRCAMEGLSTLVVDRYSLLGGSATNALVCPMMPTYVDHLEVLRMVEGGLAATGTPTRDDYTTMVWFAPEQLGMVFEDLLYDNGGQALYDATLVGVVCEAGRITHAVLSVVEGLVAVAADSFVDASGDAALARAAGVATSAGDEEGANQVSSLRFTMGGVDVERYRDYVLSLDDHFSPLVDGYFFESAMVAGRGFKLEPTFRRGVEAGILREEDLRYYQTFSLPGKPGCIALNCPHVASMKSNTTAVARTAALREAHGTIRRLARFLHEMMPGFEGSYVMQVAPLIGIRESWRVRGKYLLTEDDYARQARFDDGVVKGDWYIDVHSNKKGLYHNNTYRHGDYYEIPWRSMVCDEVPNLAVVGRCISATFLMQASVRILPTVIDMGDVAGSACALSARSGVVLADLDGSRLRRFA